MIKWQEVFSKNGQPWRDATCLSAPVAISDLESLKNFLDAVHVRFCLVKPYQENKNYPVVEGRELLPSFDNDMFEYRDLPGFSLVAFARQLDYFSEIFAGTSLLINLKLSGKIARVFKVDSKILFIIIS